jgi:tetratricopeptide (TPR) repeat protein
MITNRPVWCAAMLVVTMSGAGPAAPVNASQTTPLEAAVERGDQSYAHGQLREALASYQQAIGIDAAHFSALCGLARVESELSESAPGEERRRLVAAAVEHARAAVKAAPDHAQGHVWLAVALGQQAQMEGPKTRAGLWREIRSELDRAIGIDPGIARAYLERGRWNQRLSTRGIWERSVSKVLLAHVPHGASMDNAVRDLEKAVELAPGDIECRMELARAYLKLDRFRDARRELERVVAIPAGRPRDPGLQAEAREQLEKLAKRG